MPVGHRRTGRKRKAKIMRHSAGLANVLLVEDEPMTCDLVTGALCDGGYVVHAVPDAEQALRYLEYDPPVDVLLTDIMLPGEMNGAQLAQRVRAMRPELPIVYSSGPYSQSEIEPLVSRSMFLAKPYDPADLCRLFNRFGFVH